MGKWVPLNSAEAQSYLQQNPAANAYVSNYLKNVSLPQAQQQSAQAGADVAQNTVGADITTKQAGAVSAGANAQVDTSTIPGKVAAGNAPSVNVPLPTSTSTNSGDLTQQTWSAYKDAYEKATNSADRVQIANEFKDTFGKPLFSLYLNGSDSTDFSSNLALKNTVNTAINGINSDPALKDVLGNPAKVALLNLAYKTGAVTPLENALGLNQYGKQAVDAINQLQGMGDYQLIHGRVTGNLANLFKPSQVQWGRSAEDNLNKLTQMSQNIDSANNYIAKQNGISDWTQIPGADAYSQDVNKPTNNQSTNSSSSQKAGYGDWSSFIFGD